MKGMGTRGDGQNKKGRKERLEKKDESEKDTPTE